MEIEKILASLNDEQIKPVRDTEGPVLVIAGAGSGKTRVLTSRIAYILTEKCALPWEILAITFTNKAADEMKERISKMVGEAEGMWVSTIHSMCTRILRKHISALGYDKNFTIYSDVDKDRVLKRLFTSGESEDERFLKNAKWHISNAKMLGMPPDRYLIEKAEEKDIDKYCEFYRKYEEELKASNALDFDDLLLKTRDLFLEHDDIRSEYSERFKYVHVDEFQDTNAVQYEIIRMLCQNHGNIFVVGDDDQSIYGWRGADINNILGFEKDFNGSKVYKLERNYRSTKRILRLANAIIRNNKERKQKELWTENDEGVRVETYAASDETNEATYAAVQIKSLMARGYSASDFAVLMRINALSRVYEQEFLKYGIPYKVFGGFKFYERKEIKDLLAYFRILVNPLDNDAILRIINVPKRGIGDRTVSLMLDYAKDNGVCLYDGLLDVDKLGLPTATRARITEFKDLIVSLVVDKETKSLTDLLECVLKKTNYLSMFDEDTDENFSKKANIGELQNSIKEFAELNPDSGLADFLNSVTLSSDIDEMDDGSYVTLATVHSVKGLEFRSVFICGLEEEVFPVSRAWESLGGLEEERRLMYVAITRAEERLFLTYAQSRFLFGKRQDTVRSRFVGELAKELGVPEQKPRYVREERRFYGDVYGGDEPDASPSYGRMVTGAKSFMQSSKPKVVNENTDGYAVGKKVRHVKFGEGTIVAVKGSGNGKVVDVAFKGIGVKSLAVQYAPMELIS